MTFLVRPASTDDVPLVAPWTADTFEWGDYVGEALPDWIADQDVYVIVCELEDGTPAAVCRAQMLSGTEGWLDAARVHPDHRRSGLGNALNHAGMAWAADHGAMVVRLAVEANNESAMGQVVKLGYHETSRWVYGSLEVVTTDRLPEGDRLRPSHSSDRDGAWMFWSTSDLALAAHDLFPQGWLWRRMGVEDLEAAVAAKHLLQNPAGWVIAEARTESLSVNFMATAPADAPRMLQALIDHEIETATGVIEVKLPSTPWVTEALTRSGFEVKEIVVFSKAVN